MDSLNLDVLIIGWGKAGKSIASKLIAAGKKVALVERSTTMYGGTCINIACVPTKKLITLAERRSEHDDPAQYFMKSVNERDAFISKLNAVNYSMLDGKALLIDGEARFTGAHEVRITPTAGKSAPVGDAHEEITLHAPTIIINTGTVPATLKVPGADLPGVYNSTTIQHANPFPQRLAIIGGGMIGLEFATMFSGFGSNVTVIDPGERLLRMFAPDIASEAHANLEAQGVKFALNSKVQEITQSAEGSLQVHTDQGTIDADAVLVAVGRAPATAGLGLDAAGIAVTERGFIQVDEHLRTNVAGVYAVGDVNGGPQFTYISFDDHRILADELLGEGKRTTTDRVAVPHTIFLNPPLASVGMSEAEARAAGRAVAVKQAKIADIAVMPRPKIVGNPAGLAKFVLDADTDEILGAVLYCVDSQELINTVALAMRLGAPAAMLRDGIWTHPASTEVFNGVL
ncbi:MAG: FAD-dependent oxidoreductase [Arcanobacterium sp.]|nr:FAD-dependent oxidoreductase [Arcanobacterium sp.]